MPRTGPASESKHDPTLDDKVQLVKNLVELFRAERMVHLGTTILSLVMLLTSAAVMLIRRGADPAALTLMFGSSGLITYSANRLLRMWDQAIKLVLEAK